MSKATTPKHDPIPIGEISAPPFVYLPEPARMFARRAERFRALAQGHKLSTYLLFLADLNDAQAKVLDGLPEAEMPDHEAIARAREFEMPPLDRNKFKPDDAFDKTFHRLLALLKDIDQPGQAAAALKRVEEADPLTRAQMLVAVLGDSIPVEQLAEHIFVAAVVQVHFARLASQLDGKKLVAVSDGACPACGSPPVSSMVVGWPGAANSRFCACASCGTLWNYVRIKCTSCGSTEGIGYQELSADSEATVKAETCDKCKTYTKILLQQKDTGLEPVADDVASLGLDILMRDSQYRRAAFNPFILGY